MSVVRICSALALGCALVACSANADAPTEPTTFIAFGEDFANYRTWPSFEIMVDAAPGNDHLVGPRRVFYNRRPAAGATSFPIGTIFVKESGNGDLPTRHVFAMVKRGGDFNASGAKGWEWFELVNDTSGHVLMLWRGEGPPNGDAYGSGTTGGCNACHGGTPKTDYVFSPELAGALAR
jgi:hypothetical protein